MPPERHCQGYKPELGNLILCGRTFGAAIASSCRSERKLEWGPVLHQINGYLARYSQTWNAARMSVQTRSLRITYTMEADDLFTKWIEAGGDDGKPGPCPSHAHCFCSKKVGFLNVWRLTAHDQVANTTFLP